MNENQLRDTFILRAPERYPHVRLYVRHILDVQAIGASGKQFRAHAGIPGQADIWGFCRGGRHLEIETKAHKHKWYAAQLAWRELCTEWGIPYLALRALPNEPPDDTIARWLAELGAIVS